MTSPTLYLLTELRAHRAVIADAREQGYPVAAIADLEAEEAAIVEQLFDGGEGKHARRSHRLTALRPAIMPLEQPWLAIPVPFETLSGRPLDTCSSPRTTRPDALAVLAHRESGGGEWISWAPADHRGRRNRLDLPEFDLIAPPVLLQPGDLVRDQHGNAFTVAQVAIAGGFTAPEVVTVTVRPAGGWIEWEQIGPARSTPRSAEMARELERVRHEMERLPSPPLRSTDLDWLRQELEAPFDDDRPESTRPRPRR